MVTGVPSPRGIQIVPMREEHIDALKDHLQEGDRVDCSTHGRNPEMALRDGYEGGPAWCALVDGEPRGAFGVMPGLHSIWSLWADLSQAESIMCVRLGRLWLRMLAAWWETQQNPHVGFFRLHNYVWASNRKTLRWLKATGCFAFHTDHTLTVEGKSFIPFTLKPLRELPFNV